MSRIEIETRQRVGSELGLRGTIALLCLLWQGAVVGASPSVQEAASPATAQSDQYEWTCSTADKKTGEPIADVHISWELRRPPRAAEGGEASLWKGQFVSDRNGKYEVRIPKSVVDAAQAWVGIEYHHWRYLPSRHSSWPLRRPDDPIGKDPDHRHAKLEPGVKVSGLIVQPDGSPARNVPVMFGAPATDSAIPTGATNMASGRARTRMDGTCSSPGTLGPNEFTGSRTGTKPTLGP